MTQSALGTRPRRSKPENCLRLFFWPITRQAPNGGGGVPPVQALETPKTQPFQQSGDKLPRGVPLQFPSEVLRGVTGVPETYADCRFGVRQPSHVSEQHFLSGNVSCLSRGADFSCPKQHCFVPFDTMNIFLLILTLLPSWFDSGWVFRVPASLCPAHNRSGPPC